MIEQIVGRYFRATTMGAENIPHGRALIVACHSGVMPWDALAPRGRDLSAHGTVLLERRSRVLGTVMRS